MLGERRAVAALVAAAVGRILRVVPRRDEPPVLTQVGREDLRVPATARVDLHHGHAGLETEELERLARMPELVPRAILIAAVSARHRSAEVTGRDAQRRRLSHHRFGRRRRGGLRLSTTASDEEREEESKRLHGSLIPSRSRCAIGGRGAR